MSECMRNGVALGILLVFGTHGAFAFVRHVIDHRRHQRQERDRWRNETFKKPGDGE